LAQTTQAIYFIEKPARGTLQERERKKEKRQQVSFWEKGTLPHFPGTASEARSPGKSVQLVKILACRVDFGVRVAAARQKTCTKREIGHVLWRILTLPPARGLIREGTPDSSGRALHPAGRCRMNAAFRWQCQDAPHVLRLRKPCSVQVAATPATPCAVPSTDGGSGVQPGCGASQSVVSKTFNNYNIRLQKK